MRRLWGLAMLVACYNGPTPVSGDGTGGGDPCLGDGVLRVCFDDGPAIMDRTISASETIDTSMPANCSFVQSPTMQDEPETCVVLAKRFVVVSGFTLAGVGPRPLAIVATDSITIQLNALLDVSSNKFNTGAGSTKDESLCNPAREGTASTSSLPGSGGGAGGSFGSGGGAGGAGNAGGNSGAPMTTPRLAFPFIRGGCTGGGAGNVEGMSGAFGGPGGGAVYLIARNSITIEGYVNASGSGGYQSPVSSGGAGGGSGGFIGFDATTYTIGASAKIFASGGSGSAGATSSQPGLAGAEATPTSDPPFTNATTGAGIGGAGRSMTAGDSGMQGNLSFGGGGGGGGAGHIVVTNKGSFTPNPNVVRPPAVMINPRPPS